MTTPFNSERGRIRLGWLAAVVLLFVGTSCGGSQRIHHYQPEVVTENLGSASRGTSSDIILAIEDFSAGSAYDERRIVYREKDYRFDYYHFHRWAAPPGMLVSDTLREVYRRTGAFRSVVGGYAARADVILAGRVIALEEVDKDKKNWIGRVVLDLRLRDAKSGELLWSSTVSREKKLEKQNPRGLAAAISRALTDIGIETAADIVQMGKQSIRQRREARRNNPFRNEKSSSSGGAESETSGESE